MLIRTTWNALARPGFLTTGRPWRASAYLLAEALLGLVTLLLLVLLLAIGLGTSILLIGIPLLFAFGLAGIPIAAAERRCLRIVDDRPAPGPHADPDRPGLSAWLRTRFQEQATWRELAYGALFALVLWPLDLVAVVVLIVAPVTMLATPVLLGTAEDGEIKLLKTVLINSGWQATLTALAGLVALAVAGYLVALWSAARATLTRTVLVLPESELRDRTRELVRSRARLVEAFEAERRRIERDLHDGAQQQLVALGMTLGLARLAPPDETAELVAQAHEQAKAALTGLGELIRGIHPRVLSDRGLAAAVDELADRSPTPVDVDILLPHRPPAAVEATAYFVVAEALANVGKHSEAARATVTGRYVENRLVLTVTDDGLGGADAARGTGLTGLGDRVAVLDGRLALSSPPGGPTELRLEVPCVRTPAVG